MTNRQHKPGRPTKERPSTDSLPESDLHLASYRRTAGMLDISTKEVGRKVRSGELAVVHVGPKSPRIKLSVIAAFIKQRERAGVIPVRVQLSSPPREDGKDIAWGSGPRTALE